MNAAISRCPAALVIGDDPLEFRRVRGTYHCTVPKTDPATPMYLDTTLAKRCSRWNEV
jgi:hypothetical protein